MIKDGDILDTMEWDLQQMLYLWATNQEFKEMPKVMLKNVIRRPGHRQGKKEDKRSFFERVASEVSDPKNFDHFFMRFQLHIVPKDLYFWEGTQLKPILEDQRDWWEGKVRHYMNPTALLTKYGRCGMFAAVAKGDLSPYVKRKHVFPELEN